MKLKIGKCFVRGIGLNQRTNCRHYSSLLDIVAIRFKCCHCYFACYLCHEQIADHLIKRWELNDLKTKAIFCGNCRRQLTIEQYLKCSFHCPYCRAQFNSGCQKHWTIYFEEHFSSITDFPNQVLH